MSSALRCFFGIIQFIASTRSYPQYRFEAYQENSNNFLEPSYVGIFQTAEPQTAAPLDRGILAGFHYFDHLVPDVDLKPFPQLSKPAKLRLNATRTRRHEVIQSITINSTMPPSTTETMNVLPMVEPSTVRTPHYTLDLAPPMMQNKNDIARNDLEMMIHQLNAALEDLKHHAGELSTVEEVNEQTTTQNLVQYISAKVEQILKQKNLEQRAMLIKNMSNALNILLSRIARSAKAAAIMDSGQVRKDGADPVIIARIIHHLAAMKMKQDNEKLIDGYELSSAELDTGLANLRAIRQGGNSSKVNENDDRINAIDGAMIDEVEQIGGNSTTDRPLEVTARQEDDSSSSSEEGGGNVVTNLVSSLLGSLSTPSGGVDVGAIVTLIGGLSVEREDGTFDFSGLTELLQSFFGKDEEAGTPGSDVGSFLGGFLGATLQGMAIIPGPKGTGKLTGNLIANILPGLSGPPPPGSDEEAASSDDAHHYDSGSFLAGLLSSMFASSSGGFIGGSSGNGGHGHQGSGSREGNNHSGSGSHEHHQHGSVDFFINLKNLLFKTIFGVVTSLVGASSQGVTHAAGASSSSSSGHKHHYGH